MRKSGLTPDQKLRLSMYDPLKKGPVTEEGLSFSVRLPDDAELLSVRKSRYGMGGRETGAAIYVYAFLFWL